MKDDLYWKVLQILNDLDAEMAKTDAKTLGGITTNHMVAAWKARDQILGLLKGDEQES